MIEDIRELLVCIAIGAILLLATSIWKQQQKMREDIDYILKVAEMYER